MGRTPEAFRLRIANCGLRIVGLALVAAAGCAAPPKPLLVCPGTSNLQEALQVLRVRAKQAVPFEARGECRLAYHVPDEKGVKHQSVNLPNVWFDPPSDVLIRGSVTTDQRAVMVGSNDQEFWLALHPKEISSYYWGRWEEAANAEGMLINPAIVLEAFGILGHEDPNAQWQFTKQGPYDVLTRLNTGGRPARRLYIYSCDCLVHKMEHFGPDGQVVATAELKDYELVTGDFRVPTRIHVTTIDRSGREDTLDIDLGTPKPKKFTPQQMQQFVRNPADVRNFDHVYRLANGYWVSQPSRATAE
jgi:hypothetical protein